MSEIVPLRPALPAADILWAVVATQGRKRVIADVHLSREAAEADCSWRAAQVRAYAHFLLHERRAPPVYRVERIRRAELPGRWSPLPALGMLRGRLI